MAWTEPKTVFHLVGVSCRVLLGVQETVLLVNRAFVPLKEGVFDENGENDEFAF